jgi:hypothetical protein
MLTSSRGARARATPPCAAHTAMLAEGNARHHPDQVVHEEAQRFVAETARAPVQNGDEGRVRHGVSSRSFARLPEVGWIARDGAELGCTLPPSCSGAR